MEIKNTGNTYNEGRKNSYHHHQNLFIETSKASACIFNVDSENYN
jgi:hypothetical protein